MKLDKQLLLKRGLFALALLAVTVAALLIGRAMNPAQPFDKRPELEIVADASRFSDYYIDQTQGKVFIACEISVLNTARETLGFTFTAAMPAEAGGLLKSETLTPVYRDGAPGQYLAYSRNVTKIYAVFVGEYGGTDTLKNQELPQLTLVPLTGDITSINMDGNFYEGEITALKG